MPMVKHTRLCILFTAVVQVIIKCNCYSSQKNQIVLITMSIWEIVSNDKTDLVILFFFTIEDFPLLNLNQAHQPPFYLFPIVKISYFDLRLENANTVLVLLKCRSAELKLCLCTSSVKKTTIKILFDN